MNERLLTRDEFRRGVQARDGHACIFCGSTEKLDSHHILERRLFTEQSEIGGYFLSNGATVCEPCHMKCEQTVISVDDVRQKLGLTRWTIPQYMYDDENYDKWGNIILANGLRTKGPLFYDESVQKVLRSGGVLSQFTDYVKYPRTLHLPWSESINSDDRVAYDLSHWIGRRVIVTEKMDGENTSIYPNYMHARSVDGRSHSSRDLTKAFASRWQYDLPEAWRLCGENLFARHSIAYDDLPHHFMGFSIWNDRNIRLGWDDTLEWFELLGITPVPVLYDGTWDEQLIKSIKIDSERSEGYVVTIADSMSYAQFSQFMAKYVRRDHVQTVKHWMHGQPIVPNGFKEKF